ncbi:hypothetical protein MPSEU_000444700 [Mayamaea pseudoterrestris]|nr:hypothetical protein MPSEU_000444700 [Mayamaea pseudoterrestris]
MRTFAFLVLLVAPALGFSFRDVNKNKIEGEELPQVRGGARDVGTHRTLKGSKGASKKGPPSKKGASKKGASKGKGGSKGSGASPICEMISVWTAQRDYTKNGILIGDFGEAIEGLPIYDRKTNRIIATLTETVIDAGEDCTATGSINFGLNNARGRTRNQLLYQGTCSGGLTNAVTGGTGVYTGAKGVMRFSGQRSNRFFFELMACDKLS